jgi:hypothetical protein
MACLEFVQRVGGVGRFPAKGVLFFRPERKNKFRFLAILGTLRLRRCRTVQKYIYTAFWGGLELLKAFFLLKIF